jgi:hypothetical protein
MGSSFSLFQFDDPGTSRIHENRFQWFVATRDEKSDPRCIRADELGRLLKSAREPSNHTVVGTLARLLGISLERKAYDLFIEDIGLPVAITAFYDETIANSDGFPDLGKMKDHHYRKYCFFKFASFLDLLCPDVLQWRGQARLESVPLTMALARFLAADPAGRAALLSRWLRQPKISAFSAKSTKARQTMNKRREFLLTLEHLKAADVARRLDTEGFKPQKHPSYAKWFLVNRASFESWLSDERAECNKT